MNKCIKKERERGIQRFIFIIHDNRMHVDDNQSQQKLDHFHRCILNKIENYDQQLEL
jgi:hypothetical protein